MSMSSSSSSNKGRDVPDDVIIEIFSFIPADSLLRFRFACKSWFNLITSNIHDPSFVQMHTHHLHHPHYIATTPTYSSPTIFCTSTKPLLNHTLYSLNNINALSSSSSSKNKETLIEIDYPFKSCSSRLEILGSCNGLLCIQVLGYQNNVDVTITNNGVETMGILCLWNPSTKELEKVPSTSFKLPEHELLDFKVTYGFGYDRFTDDYKLVILVWFCTLEDGLQLNRSQVKVYTQGTNSWKRERVLDKGMPYSITNSLKMERVLESIDKGMPYSILQHSPKKVMGLYVNGALHWISTYFNSDVNLCFRYQAQTSTDIYAFDIKDEEFRVVPKPAECSDRLMFKAELQVLRGCLCIFSCYNDQDYESRFEMWMMMDYGVKESWTKLFRAIDPTLMISLKPLWLWRNGEVLIGNGAALNLEHLVIYDPNNNKVIKTIDSQEIPFDWENAIVHIGSFVPLKLKSNK